MRSWRHSPETRWGRSRSRHCGLRPSRPCLAYSQIPPRPWSTGCPRHPRPTHSPASGRARARLLRPTDRPRSRTHRLHRERPPRTGLRSSPAPRRSTEKPRTRWRSPASFSDQCRRRTPARALLRWSLRRAHAPSPSRRRRRTDLRDDTPPAWALAWAVTSPSPRAIADDVASPPRPCAPGGFCPPSPPKALARASTMAVPAPTASALERALPPSPAVPPAPDHPRLSSHRLIDDAHAAISQRIPDRLTVRIATVSAR